MMLKDPLHEMIIEIVLEASNLQLKGMKAFF